MEITRVLVVDDDAAMADVLRELIVASGRQAACVHDVESALEVFARERPDVVLSDLHMPGRGGLDLLAAIRAHWPGTPVVLMSAFPGPDTRKQGLEAGAVAFLSKPFSVHDLLDALSVARGE
jgi:CheY-like chemotaxis protein